MYENEVSGEVKQYPYRTARVSDIICELPRELHSDLERQLAEKSGHSIDNHVVYELQQFNREPVYFKFSDLTLTLAKSVREELW